jgi:amino acid adenylation domain-containing protein
LNAVDLGERLVCTFEYCTGLFAPATIERFIAYFKRIVDLLSWGPDRELSQLVVVTEAEKQQILYEFNDTEPQFPTAVTIHRLFEEQAEKTPDAIAVHRTYRTYITLGGAYVPLNPQVPPSRNEYILKECSAGILVSGVSKDSGAVPLSGLNKDIEVIDLNETLLTHSTYPTHLTHLTHLWCYAIFTSGSTGKPKGVPITHSNLCPLLHWGYKHLGIGSKDRVIQNLSYYFDWSVWEIFITLTTGAGLYMVPGELLLNPEVCVPFMTENEITVLHVTPTQYQHLIHSGHKLESLKYLFLGAEKLTVDLLKRSFASVSEACRVFNMYGPTEATIISAVLETSRGDETKFEALTSVPIGEPAANAPLLVLDRYLKLCPVKVTGELYIAGDGLANGYLNDPEKTQGVFVKNPYESEGVTGDRLYKTGDLVRWLPDGNVEFLGRIDHQIKIRGYRIELGEIENQLLKHPEVKETVVIAREEEEEERYLAAYIVFAGKHSLAGAEAGPRLREFLSRDLPDYMVPSFFVPMDKIPVTANGKVDRRALPEPEAGEGGEQEYIPPGNEVESKLVEIWSDLLGLEKDKISMNADFFRLGGHSLKVAAMMAKIKESFDVKIDLMQIFTNPTAREIASLIKAIRLTKEKEQDMDVDMDQELEELVL